jgi:ATP-dependent RNA helicase DDX5/DBP2
MFLLAKRTRFNGKRTTVIKRHYEHRDSRNERDREPSSKTLGKKLNMNINWSELDNIIKNIYEENPNLKKMSDQDVTKWRKENVVDTKGLELPKPILNFDLVPFPESVKKLLKGKYTQPTPIQAQAWPIAMSGKDLVGSAETGSGKTMAFLLPIFQQISSVRAKKITEVEQAKPISLVVAPTRELVKQIYTESLEYSRLFNTFVHYVHGGQGNRMSQGRGLLNNPKLIIGTPGRIIDFIEENCLSLESVNSLVLDEADRMFEMGFEEQLKMILSQVRPDRQVMMFSATWPKKVSFLAREYFKDYIHINVGPEDLSANKNVSQKFEFIPVHKKVDTLVDIIKKNEGKKVLVFCSTKVGCTELSYILKSNNVRCGEIHGDKTQIHRENILDDLKTGKIKVLVATDVAARGIDIKDINIVINFDFPKRIEDYVHRIGRTGRAGRLGDSITFFTPMDGQYAVELINTLKQSGQPIPEQLRTLSNNWSPYNNRSQNNNNRREGSSKMGLMKYSSNSQSQSRNYSNRSYRKY